MGDHPYIIENKSRGLFNPNEPTSISDSIQQFYSLDEKERIQ